MTAERHLHPFEHMLLDAETYVRLKERTDALVHPYQLYPWQVSPLLGLPVYIDECPCTPVEPPEPDRRLGRWRRPSWMRRPSRKTRARR
jgi:hypothetical protein